MFRRPEKPQGPFQCDGVTRPSNASRVWSANHVLLRCAAVAAAACPQALRVQIPMINNITFINCLSHIGHRGVGGGKRMKLFTSLSPLFKV